MFPTGPSETYRSHYSTLAEPRYTGCETSSSSRTRSVSPSHGKGSSINNRPSPLVYQPSYHRTDSTSPSFHSLDSAIYDCDHSSLPYINKKAPQQVDTYPTPPPSPDLIDLVILPNPPKTSSPLVSHYATIPDTKESYSQTDCRSDNDNVNRSVPHSTSGGATQTIRYKRSTPAIPISLLLNTPHSLPHAAPFKLTQATGILSVLGGNRVLQIDRATSVMDRMPYSAASTNGLMLTQDQGEEASVEAMLEGAGPPSKSTPLSPDQSYV